MSATCCCAGIRTLLRDCPWSLRLAESGLIHYTIHPGASRVRRFARRLSPEVQSTLHPHQSSLRELVDGDFIERVAGALEEVCGGPVAICDPDGFPIEAEDAAEPARGGYSAPVLVQGRSLGAVVLLREDPDEISRKLADLVADMLGHLCKREERVRRRVNELTAVYDLGGLFAGALDLHAILNTAATRVCEVMNAKAAGIRLLDEDTRELLISGVHNLSQAYLDKGPIRLDESPIDRAAFNGEVTYIADARTDPRIRYPEHARSEGLVSGLCCPMTYRGRTVGVIRVYTGQPYKFSRFEVELLRAVAAQAAGAVVNSRLIGSQIAARRNLEQVRYAAQVQRRMIPTRPPNHSRIQFGQVYEPSLDLGGDFFDYLDLPGGNVGLAIADVVGKGIPGALMMASVRSALRAHAHSIFNLNEIVSQVNRHLTRDTLPSEFATLFYGVFSSAGDRFTYCNAGHNPPLLLRGEKFTPLETGGMVIGVSAEETFERQVVEVRSGDILVFYTDGVTEALTFQGEAYGTSRLYESILRNRNEAAPTLANQLRWDVRRFVGLARQGDDITIVVAKVL